MSKLLEARRAAGARIIDLTESNPTRAGIEYPTEILEALADPRGLHYEPSPAGRAEARAAVARYYGGRIDASQILLTASSSEAYAFLLKLLCDPGDEVLVPRPSYPLFEFLASLEGVRARQYPLRYDVAWHIDFPSLEAGITPRTRAIVVVNPNNPTGSFLKCDELERLVTLGLPLISDEVFADYSFGADEARMAGESRTLTFTLGGLSKLAGLPQMKLGWMVVSHPEAMSRLELIADTYLSVATPVQLALPRLMEGSTVVRNQIAARTLANLAWLREAVRGNPAFEVLDVEGGWYATLRAPRTLSEEQRVLELLGEHDVLVQPGYFYDFESEAFLVVSLLTEPHLFRQGVARLLESSRGSGR